eukprot:TRINITY_DN7350_c0_g1_i2.p1 TRINITY_DN7350_c0_g1~~TRINITY_DN7350_c0_g1_i2.p1  ORF type:complete len:198 (+),score=25.05 TRINITY_DN7350_c0_g1_i2:174-767(+)
MVLHANELSVTVVCRPIYLHLLFHQVRLRGRDPKCVACGDTPNVSKTTISSINYEVFTQSAMSDEAPVRIARLPPALGLSCKEYQLRREKGESHVLLDVRSRNEYSIVNLPSSVNIPFPDLEGQMSILLCAMAEAKIEGDLNGGSENAVPVYVVCRRGNDSQLAVELLRSAGIDTAFDVVGGLESWVKEVDPQFPGY